MLILSGVTAASGGINWRDLFSVDWRRSEETRLLPQPAP
jgi:hypothetical protein